MSHGRAAPRTLDFFVLRTCERFHMREAEFDALPYADQVRLLAFEQLRREDEADLAAS